MKGDEKKGEGCGGANPTAEHIARVASELFACRGFAATPVRAIADAAGVTCPTLYYHFKSKEGLAQELLIRPSSEVVESLRNLLACTKLDALSRLVRMADALLDFSRLSPERARFLYAVMFGPSDPCLAAEAEVFVRQINGLLVKAVERLAEAGFVAPERVLDVAKSIRGQVVIYTMDFLYRNGSMSPDLAGRIISDVLLGLAVPEHRNTIETMDLGRTGARDHE